MISHSFANVGKDGIIRPERYCDRVGLEIPSSVAIWLLLFPQVSISLFKLFVIRVCKFSIIN